MLAKKNRVKLYFVSVLLSCTILVPISTLRAETAVSADVYWRYQGEMLSSYILHHEGLYLEQFQSPQSMASKPFPTHSLLARWPNRFTDNFLAPLIVSIVSLITDSETLWVASLPLFTFAMLFSQLVVTKQVFSTAIAVPVGMIFAVSYRYFVPHLTTNAHRGALAWALFFTLLSYLFVLNNRKGVLPIVVIGSISLMLPMSAHTLPLVSIPFFIVLFASDRLRHSHSLPGIWLILIVTIIVTYNGFIFWFFPQAFKKLLISALVLNNSGFLLNFSIFSNSSAVLTTPLRKFLLATSTTDYLPLYMTASIFAVVVATFSVALRLHKLVEYRNLRGLEKLDVLIIAVCLHGVFLTLSLPFFAPSGGNDPRLLLLFFTPIFGTCVILNIQRMLEGRIKREWYLVGIVIVVLITPAFSVQILSSQSEYSQLNDISESQLSQVDWASNRLTQRVTSDFNTLSLYYAAGGRGESYLVVPGEPSYGANEKAQKVIKLYYTDPASAHNKAGAYMVTDSMQKRGLIHLGSLETVPNPALTNQLKRSNQWNLVYTNGHDRTFVS